MTDPHTTTGGDGPNPLAFSKEVDDPKTLIVVYVAVLGLTFLSVGLSSLVLGKFALPMQLAIAAVQAGLVAYHFMHLKQGDRVVILTALSSLFWMGILFVLFMADYMTRRLIVGW
jgi:cytochrome c oxidase subunit IV